MVAQRPLRGEIEVVPRIIRPLCEHRGRFFITGYGEENTMKPLTSIIILTLVLTMGLSGTAFAAEDQPLIGIIQIVDHVALDAARQGFIDTLAENGYMDGETVALDYRNAQGSPDILSSIADHFVAAEADLVLAIATPSAQTMAGKTDTIPILATAVTDFVVARLAQSDEAPGYNVSGTTDMNPIKEQIELLKRLVPDAQSVGLLYTASEDNSVLQAAIAREIIEDMGMAYVEVTVHNSNDVQQATLDIMERCDAIYIPTDNVFASAMPVVYEVAAANNKPVFCGEAGMTMGGGVATVGIDYYQLGRQTGLMALKVLNDGADVSAMPIEKQTNYSYTVNQTFADAIGVAIPEDLAAYAQEME